MARRLSRRHKTRVAVLQLAQCGYCACALPEAFEVDHMDQRRWNDRSTNLLACCANCHAAKTLVERRPERVDELHAMLRRARNHKRQWRAALRDMDDAELGKEARALPSWLVTRCGGALDATHMLRLGRIALQPAPDWSMFAFKERAI